MAPSAATEEHVTIRIMVDVDKDRVVFAHAGKDFVDVLLSFLTLPLGTIARLVSKESHMKKLSFGSLSSLYESVANLEVKHFWSETCKEMLLQPRNSMQSHCQKLKFNIDDTENLKYFICQNWECSRQPFGGLLSTFKNKRCKCGKLMNREISPINGVSRTDGEGFVPKTTAFIISDDLKVLPEDFQASAVLFGIEDYNVIEEITVNVTPNLMLDLLKFSLVSKQPLTDLMLMKKGKKWFPLRHALDFNIGEPQDNVKGKMVKVKVVLRKSDAKILFALGEEDFVDFLFSFLTFPLGRVEKMLKGNSCLGSIDNLYKSIVNLDECKYLRSPDLKDKLVKCKLAHQFKLEKPTLPIPEVLATYYSCYSKYDFWFKFSGHLTEPRCNGRDQSGNHVYAPLMYLEPQSSSDELYNNNDGKGFAKGPSLYMITDNLEVIPNASISVVSFLAESRIPSEDLEGRTISIGMEEGLSILKASLISSSALTNGLAQFIKPNEM